MIIYYIYIIYKTLDVYGMCFLLMPVFIVATNSRLERSPIVVIVENSGQCVHVRAIIRISYIFLSFIAVQSLIINFVVMTIRFEVCTLASLPVSSDSLKADTIETHIGLCNQNIIMLHCNVFAEYLYSMN